MIKLIEALIAIMILFGAFFLTITMQLNSSVDNSNVQRIQSILETLSKKNSFREAVMDSNLTLIENDLNEFIKTEYKVMICNNNALSPGDCPSQEPNYNFVLADYLISSSQTKFDIKTIKIYFKVE